MKRLRLAAAVAAAALFCMGGASDPGERIKDPAQEARAEHLFTQLRCVVCQNESIDDSEADLASDLRRIVREQIASGKSDEQVRAFMVQRYGEIILLQPPLNPGNAALWLGPLVLLLGGGIYLWRRTRAPPTSVPALSPEEERALSALDEGYPSVIAPHTDGAAASGK